MESQHYSSCPCGRGKPYLDCCAPFLTILGIQDIDNEQSTGTLLIDWIEKYSIPIMNSFRKRAWHFAFRISRYLDIFFDYLYPLSYKKVSLNQDEIDESIISIKHNILLSNFASFSCLSQGLFLQSGALIRCCIEDAFVLLDLFENPVQYEKFINDKYSTNRLVSRIKKFLPKDVINWYGHYSRNFAHFGPFHSAPYIPRACYPDNYVIGSGIENLLLSTYTFHIILERIHFSQIEHSVFWEYDGRLNALVFIDDNRVSNFVHKLQKQIVSEFPPEERKNGYTYSNQNYRAK